jgi:hypothetical protein
MRTTLNLDDQILAQAKHQALEENTTLAQLIENALRESLAKPKMKRKKIKLITASGPGVKPGVDLDNGRSLLGIMGDAS